jgi:hypothetical protein
MSNSVGQRKEVEPVRTDVDIRAEPQKGESITTEKTEEQKVEEHEIESVVEPGPVKFENLYKEAKRK